MNTSLFSALVLNWFAQHGRKNLPWQQELSAYRVWLSEIMLQQTQVATVIPYFQRFIAQYPTVKDLAAASIDDVLLLWAGLGYYARGRNLHRTAQMIVEKYNGEFPQDVNLLQSLPGIGRSTAGAIAALAYAIPAPILDGNVKRVLTRYHAIAGWTSSNKVSKQLWELAEQYTPKQQTGAYTQAMMDLGAMICTRSNPKCSICPLAKSCTAYNLGQTHAYPQPKPTKQLPVKSIVMLLLKNKDHILLIQRPPVGIWGGLWSLPECPIDADLNAWCRQQHQIEILDTAALPVLRHTFSHFHLDILPVIATAKQLSQGIMETTDRAWYNIHQPLQYGLPAPIKKLVTQFKDHYANHTLQQAK